MNSPHSTPGGLRAPLVPNWGDEPKLIAVAQAMPTYHSGTQITAQEIATSQAPVQAISDLTIGEPDEEIVSPQPDPIVTNNEPNPPKDPLALACLQPGAQPPPSVHDVLNRLQNGSQARAAAHSSQQEILQLA